MELILRNPRQGGSAAAGVVGSLRPAGAELGVEAGGDPWALPEQGLGKASVPGPASEARVGGGLLGAGQHAWALPNA